MQTLVPIVVLTVAVVDICLVCCNFALGTVDPAGFWNGTSEDQRKRGRPARTWDAASGKCCLRHDFVEAAA